MTSIDDLFKGRHLDREIINLCVRWYVRFKLCLRISCERGIDLANHALDRAMTPDESGSR